MSNLKYIRLSTRMLQDTRFSSNCCIVYCYMLNKSVYFKSKNKPYFEAQDQIATNCSISKRTVVQCIEQLVGLDYVKSELVRKGSSFTNEYSVSDVYGLYTKEKLEESFDEPF